MGGKNRVKMARKGQGYTVLVADDEQEVVDLVTIVLEAEGYSTYSAEDGEEALDKIRNTLPDLILLDIRMPKMTGLQVLDQICKEPATADIPVLMLSVVVTEPEIQSALHRGAIAYISKPFEIRELVWLVNRVLAMDATERERFRQQVIETVGKR
jgi:CheY-like chemotaxis protein